VPLADGFTEAIIVSQGVVSTLSHEDDKIQPRAMEEPVFPAEGITEAMPVNHGTASAVLFKAYKSHEGEQRRAGRAYGIQKANLHVVNNEMSAADTVSEPETDTEQKGADGSHEQRKK
jgi:hypothetical protein